MFDKKKYMKEYNQRPDIKVRKKEYQKEYNQRPEVKAKSKEYLKEYHLKNKKRIKQRQNEYLKNKRKTDLNFKIACNLRSRINHALKNNTKSAHTKELLGCSIEFFKGYLSAQFKKGMSWDNWSTGNNGNGMKEWHIDHIKPCSRFNQSNPQEQRQCWNYTNLQPLWAEENLKKGNK